MPEHCLQNIFSGGHSHFVNLMRLSGGQGFLAVHGQMHCGDGLRLLSQDTLDDHRQTHTEAVSRLLSPGNLEK
jgi:hypothetical protein